eukprot:jgi/Bigna1/90962/estExt_fgenesh1_pg.C_840019
MPGRWQTPAECLDLKNVDAGWKEVPDVMTERSFLGVVIGDGKLFAVGGADGPDGVGKPAEHLDSLKNVDARWKEIPDTITERLALGVAFGDGKVFAVGGADGPESASKHRQVCGVSGFEECGCGVQCVASLSSFAWVSLRM